MAGEKVESLDEGRELNLHIYVSDIHDVNADPVLVGFKGYTDQRGDVSILRSLVLEQKWVEPDPPWIQVKLKAIKDIFCPQRNIADDSKEKAQPIDIVDIFWEYK